MSLCEFGLLLTRRISVCLSFRLPLQTVLAPLGVHTVLFCADLRVVVEW